MRHRRAIPVVAFILFLFLLLNGCSKPEDGGHGRSISRDDSQGESVPADDNQSDEHEAPFRRTTQLGSGVGDSESMAAPSGEVRWQISTRGAVLAKPVARGPDVYFATVNGDVHGVRIDDGAELFHTSLGMALSADPVLYKERVYWLAKTGELVELDLDSHELRTLPSLSHDAEVHEGFAMKDGRIFFATLNKELVAVRLTDFSRLWSVPFEDGQSGSSPVVVGNSVYFFVSGKAGHYLQVLTASSGDYLWRQPVLNRNYVTPPVAIGAGLAATVSPNGAIVAVDVDQGLERWTFDGSEPGGLIEFAGEDFFALAGGLVRLNSEDGSPIWSSPYTGLPSVSNDDVYLSDPSGVLTVLDASSGDVKWRYQFDAALADPASVSEGIVVVATNDVYGSAGTSVTALSPPTQ